MKYLLSPSLILLLITSFSIPTFLFAQQSMDWTMATNSAQWSARGHHTSVVFDNKIWVIGGFNSTRLNDVWYSADGITWLQATVQAPWTGRFGHTSVVFDNKIWVIGGFSGSFSNDVWYSEDGTNWTQATSQAQWQARCYHTSVVFDNKIWILGGYNGHNLNDVWYSNDGINWTCATDSAEWVPRYDHTSLVFDNKIWVLGGTNYLDQDDEVWYSIDGAHWTLATDNAPWYREGHSSLVFANRMWVIGGNEYYNDAWYSADGDSWVQAPVSIGWSGRGYHTSVVFNNKIWVIGGVDAVRQRNDVWYSRGITTVTYPNGGEILNGGYGTYLRWRHIGSLSGFTRLRLLLATNGSIYNDTIANNIAPFDTMYYWYIPYLDIVAGRIKVQVLDTANSIVRQDVSDGTFTIQTYIYIHFPWYGDSLPGGSNQTIRWLSYGTNFNRYRLLFSRNGGLSYPDTIAHNVLPTETTYSWLVPSINSAQCRIKIQKIDNYNRVITESETYFKIYTPIWLAISQYPMFRYNLQHTGRSLYNGSATSELRWFFSTGAPIASSPVIAPDSTIYFVSGNNTLYALRPNGTLYGQYVLRQTTQSTPAIASDTTIYLGDGGGHLFCFPKNLVNPYWIYSVTGPITSSPAIGINGVIYFGSDNGYLYALNPDSLLRWSFDLGSPIRSSPAISSNQTIIVGSIQGKLSAINTNGVRIWDITLPAPILASPLIGPNRDIYIGCGNGKFYALDASGIVKWSFETGDSIISSAAIDNTGRIYFGSCDGYVYALEDAGNQANLIWRFETQGKVRSSPSISANGIIYIGSDDGKVYAINSDGTLVWTRLTGNAVRSSPAIGADGTIYIGSDDGRLYAIGPAPAIEENEVVNLKFPLSIILYTGQPNPFTSQTTIKFGLPRTSDVKLNIYSSSGVLLKTLVAGNMNQGYHNVTWNGRDNFGRILPAGIYFCHLETEGKQEIKKIIKL